MSDIIEHITKKYANDQIGYALQTGLKECQIPIPEHDQYFRSFNNGDMIFRNRHGAVVRIVEHEKHPLYDHPHMLRPLGALITGKLRIEINPGAKCPVRTEDAVAVHKAIEQNGLATPYQKYYGGSEQGCDIHKPYNNVYLPAQTEEFPNGFPALLDFGHVKDLNQSAKKVDKMINERVVDLITGRQLDTQDTCFYELKKAFTGAWNNNGTVNTERMTAFWQMLEAAKSDGTLTASWLESVEPASFGPNKTIIPKTSLEYESCTL